MQLDPGSKENPGLDPDDPVDPVARTGARKDEGTSGDRGPKAVLHRGGIPVAGRGGWSSVTIPRRSRSCSGAARRRRRCRRSPRLRLRNLPSRRCRRLSGTQTIVRHQTPHPLQHPRSRECTDDRTPCIAHPPRRRHLHLEPLAIARDARCHHVGIRHIAKASRVLHAAREESRHRQVRASEDPPVEASRGLRLPPRPRPYPLTLNAQAPGCYATAGTT